MATPPRPHAPPIPRLRGAAYVAAAAGLLGMLVFAVYDSAAFLRGYLFVYGFWAGISLGSLSILMLHHLVAGEWGFVGQRVLEASAQTIPLIALAYLPILIGAETLYSWANPDVVAESGALQHRQAYLNVPFLVARNVLYFGTWIMLAVALRRWSRRADETRAARFPRRERALSAAGLIAYVLLMTWATTDWYMSLEPAWYSTIYPWLIVVSHALSALSFTVVVLALMRHAPPLVEALAAKHFHDFGNLILTFAVLWTYMMFAQYLIMWTSNLPEDVVWFVRRKAGGWIWIGPFLIVFHFFVPFVALLFRRVKRSGNALALLSVGLLAVHLVFMSWLVVPAFEITGVGPFVSAVFSLVGLGGIWLLVFARALAAAPLLPFGDVRYQPGAEAPVAP